MYTFGFTKRKYRQYIYTYTAYVCIRVLFFLRARECGKSRARSRFIGEKTGIIGHRFTFTFDDDDDDEADQLRAADQTPLLP